MQGLLPKYTASVEFAGGRPSDTKRRIVERLKRVESATATDLAAEFGLTDTALRQHLDALEAAGHGVAFRRGANRPWPAARALAAGAGGRRRAFPDRHGELSVDLIGSVRSALGDEALDRVMRPVPIDRLPATRLGWATTDVAERVAAPGRPPL